MSSWRPSRFHLGPFPSSRPGKHHPQNHIFMGMPSASHNRNLNPKGFINSQEIASLITSLRLCALWSLLIWWLRHIPEDTCLSTSLWPSSVCFNLRLLARSLHKSGRQNPREKSDHFFPCLLLRGEKNFSRHLPTDLSCFLVRIAHSWTRHWQGGWNIYCRSIMGGVDHKGHYIHHSFWRSSPSTGPLPVLPCTISSNDWDRGTKKRRAREHRERKTGVVQVCIKDMT